MPLFTTHRRSPDSGRTPAAWRIPALVVIAALAAVAFPIWRGWQARRQAGRLNVILITIDTLRADYVSAYGARRASTPALDALAAAGVRFGHCVAQTPLTLPSHATILSGTYPLFHQVRDNGGFRVPEKLQLISEVLKPSGFATAAFIGAYVLHRKWGMNQGFDTYSDRFDVTQYKGILLQNKKLAGEVLGDAGRWLVGHGKNRFFAWIHLYDPHTPYMLPPPYDNRFPDDPYRGEVEYVDNELGKFISMLKSQGLWDNTLIVVAGDHGEGLGDHGEQEHGFFLYEPTVHVPLIMRMPVAPERNRVDETVELADVAPTILDLLGMPRPAQWQGRSLRPLLKSPDREGFNRAYCETHYPRLHFGWSHLQAFYSGEWKYVLAPHEELYDLSSDRREADNLADRRPAERRDMRGQALAFISRNSRSALAAETHGMSAEERQRLAALGYVGGGASDESPSAPLPDPKDKLPVFNAFNRAIDLFNRKDAAAAVQAARALVVDDPEFADAYSLLGDGLLELGRYREALAAFNQAMKFKPDDNLVMINLLKAQTAMGEFDQAVARGEDFLKIFPEDPLLLEELGRIRYRQGRLDPALVYLQRTMEKDPAATQAFNLAGEILILKKEYDRAAVTVRRLLEVNPRAKGSRFLLAQIEEARNHPAEAREYYRLELQNDPRHYRSAFNLANFLRREGKLDEAESLYRTALEANPRLKLAYFQLADLLLQKRERLTDGVALCLRGILITPRDRETLFGYFVLTNLYAALGDQERLAFYTREGEKLIASLE